MNEPRKFTFWAVYDLEQGLIKMDAGDDCLALFETEQGAAAASRATPGSAYKKLVLYSRPQPASDAALLEAFDAGRRAAQEEVHRLRSWIKDVSAQYDICTHNVLKEICDGCRCGKTESEK